MTSLLSDVADQTFDYVIAGGGTAGLAVAARLTEDPTITVAVLEAGAANINDPMLTTPVFWGKHFGDPQYDWIFPTVPQKHVNNRVHVWPRGKTLGGSSAINFYVWGRPPAEDIDAWERLGNPGWNWKRFFEYSKKSETFHPPEEVNATLYKQIFKHDSHGHSGPIHSSFPEWVHAGEVPYQQAIMSTGIKLSKDPYGGDLIGSYMSLGSLDPRSLTRSYATTGYYLPNKDRPNLRVLCNALVNRIITREEDGPAGLSVVGTGLEFEYDGKLHVVHAKRDVVLSAGALKSPQILELSGIGDSRILGPLGIKTIVDLPGVGANLQEHVWTSLIYELNADAAETLDALEDKDYAAKQLALHAERKGLHRAALTGFTWVPLASVTETTEKAREIISRLRKRIEEKYQSGLLPPGLKEQYDLQLEELETRGYGDCEIVLFPKYFGILGEPEPGKFYLSATALLNHPFSRGTIHIGSKDPHDRPTIDPRYLEEDFDLQLLVETLKFDRRVVSTEPFKSLVLKETMPGPECKTDEELRNHVKDSLCTTFHTSSTLSMLPREMNGVVDSKLRVYGTKNIRVVDLSIAPLQVAAHTQATVYAIAEQAADMIKSEIGSSS